MVKTVSVAFQEFMRRHEPTSATKETASARQTRLRESLARHMRRRRDRLSVAPMEANQSHHETGRLKEQVC